MYLREASTKQANGQAKPPRQHDHGTIPDLSTHTKNCHVRDATLGAVGFERIVGPRPRAPNTATTASQTVHMNEGARARNTTEHERTGEHRAEQHGRRRSDEPGRDERVHAGQASTRRKHETSTHCVRSPQRHKHAAPTAKFRRAQRRQHALTTRDTHEMNMNFRHVHRRRLQRFVGRGYAQSVA